MKLMKLLKKVFEFRRLSLEAVVLTVSKALHSDGEADEFAARRGKFPKMQQDKQFWGDLKRENAANTREKKGVDGREELKNAQG